MGSCGLVAQRRSQRHNESGDGDVSLLDLMNGVTSGENDKEREGGGQLAHRRDMLKDDDCWENGCRGGAKAHMGIPWLRA
jgi:hypothetical protein